MSMIYQNDPQAVEKLRVKLLKLEYEKLEMQRQNREAKSRGLPKDPPHLLDCLHSKIRQTRNRLRQLEAAREEEARGAHEAKTAATIPDAGHQGRKGAAHQYGL